MLCSVVKIICWRVENEKYLLLAMVVLAALSLMVAGCGGKDDAKKADSAKVLRVGTEPTFAAV